MPRKMPRKLDTRRAMLEALRDRLVEELQLLKESGTYIPLGKEAAPLSRELRQVMAELDSLPSEEGSVIDAIAGDQNTEETTSDGARTARERRAAETSRRNR